jgi:phosphoglycolate phosphatase
MLLRMSDYIGAIMAAATHPSIEIVRPEFPRGGYRAAFFDFDGTLSLLRGNWQPLMVGMMLDYLRETPRGKTESIDQLRPLVVRFVQQLTGEPTIFQMRRLAEEIAARGGQPLAPEVYERQFLDRLNAAIESRLDELEAGDKTLEELMVPGAADLLQKLGDRGLALWLASGTALDRVVIELGLLGLDRWFGRCVFGSLPPPGVFSKAAVIQQMLQELGLTGQQVIGIGDGFVEISAIAKAGGLAIGVASNEETREGVDAEKRRWLIEAGAHIIIGDYRHTSELLQLIGIQNSNPAEPQA